MNICGSPDKDTLGEVRQNSVELANSADPENGLGGIRVREGFQHLPHTFFEGVTTLYEAFEHGRNVDREGCDSPGIKDCLGWRAKKEDGTAGDFVFQSYDEISDQRNHLGSGILHLDICNAGDDGNKLLGIFSGNRYEWVVTEHACYAYKLVPVPLYSTLGPDAISFILQQTQMKTVVCGASETEMLIRTKQEKPEETANFTHIIQFEDVTDEDFNKAGDAGLELLSFENVQKVGQGNLKKHIEPQPDDWATIMYTSGTTGNPKGVILTHKNIIADSAGAMLGGLNLCPETIHLSYLPLAHSFERLVSNTVLSCGGKIGFFQGDVKKIVEDLQALRPTVFPSVPRLLNRIYDKITTKFADFGGLKKWLFETGLESKKYYLKQNSLTHKLWDGLVFNKTKAGLGLDRCTLMVTGSAPIAPHVMEFLRCVFGIPVIEGYGQTECSAGTSLGLVDDQATLGHVGAPFPCNQIRLESVSDMGYLVTDEYHGQDKENGHQGVRCYGRGEICIKGPNVFQGYYKEEAKTKETLDENGWLHTGDVGYWDKFGNLKIFDRIKNIFKLSQGEYVAAEKN
eukprot:gb/GECG01013429.1/.p1 GENE.gb/GECG01013429.1/~~gb/GECG01013429.1/.p1  ORF type:complete len:570 (+),score=71.20 gb/GECG01013429.1/:1-1710(+)